MIAQYDPVSQQDPKAKDKAEAWAKEHVAKNVSYDGMTIEEMNTANEVLGEVVYGARISKLDDFHATPEWDNGIAGEGQIGIGLKAMRHVPDPSAKSEHSMNYFKNQTEALIRHEVGHLFHQRYEEELFDLMPSRNWKKDYGVTKRASDHWSECIAENFALYSAGHTDVLHPDVNRAMEKLTRWRWK